MFLMLLMGQDEEQEMTFGFSSPEVLSPLDVQGPAE